MAQEITPVDSLRRTISTMTPQFKLALPKHISADKFNRVLLTAISTTPALVDADRTSLLAACMKSAQDGLLPDGKESALVTFRTKEGVKVQYMPMISGILKKVRNSGELATITAQLVYKNDVFRYWVDSDGEHLNHEPNMFEDRGAVVGTYALAKTKDGAIYIEVMTEKQVMAVKNTSKSKDFGPWSGDFAHEMWKKTVLRRLSKKLPMSTDLEDFISQDDDHYDLKNTQQPTVPPENQLNAPTENATQDVTPAEPKDKTKPNKLSGMIKDQKPVTETEPVIEAEIVETKTEDEDAPV